MAMKRKSAKSAAVVTIPVQGVEFGFAKPTLEVWERYLNRISKGELIVGRKELLRKCCVSHSTETKASKGAIDGLFERFPLLIKKIADALDGVAGGDSSPDVDMENGLVILGEVVFEAPSLALMESYQENQGDFGPESRKFLLNLAADRTQAEALFNDQPAAMGPLLGAVSEVAGANFEVTVKKG